MSHSIRYDFGLLLLRIGLCAMILAHGIPKLMQLLSGNFEFADPIGLGEPVSLIMAAIGEAVCPILILIGFKTRLATIPTLITMAVAAFVVHGADSFNTKEKALLYFVGFLCIAIMGPGRYSLDRR